MGGKGYKPRIDYAGRRVSGDWEDSDRGAGNKAATRSGNPPKKKSPTYLAYIKNKKKEVSESDAAFDKVAGDLKKKFGSGVLVGKEKPPAPTEAQKKAYKKHQEKIAKERSAEFAKDPSQGRYPPGFSNRGSD